MYPGYWGVNTPDKPAVIIAETGQCLTHGELNDRSNQLAQLYRSEGLKRGDHVALLMENHLQYLPIVWAALRSGLYVTAINWHLTPAEAAYIVEDSECSLLISSALCADIVDRIQCDAVRCRLMIGSPDAAMSQHWEDYETRVSTFATNPIDDESAGQAMLYSSGTTGRPKGVLRPLPDKAPWELPADQAPPNIATPYALDDDTVYLSPAPLYHASPLSFCRETTAKGGTAVVMERFDPLMALQALERYKVTHSQWVPTMFIRMLDLPEEQRAGFDLRSHKVAIHAAAPCPESVKRKMIDWWGPIIHEFYGGSEGFGSTRIGPQEWLERPGSVGQVRSGYVFILDEQGNELPTGERGEIFFKPQKQFEYKGDSIKTANATSQHGYKSYGDVGYLDEDGYLYLTDRKSFMIISGGVNIYPRETEDVLLMHPAVADVAVFGIPHPDFGEEVKAGVELHKNVEACEELEQALIDFCIERLAKFKCPRSIDFHASLPRLPSGKLRKADLRAPYIAASKQPSTTD